MAEIAPQSQTATAYAPLSLSRHSLLVSPSVVVSVTGLRPDQIYARVEGPIRTHSALSWVFNVSVRASGPTRCLRFWMAELSDPARCQRLTLDQVMLELLPPGRQLWYGGQVLALLSISRTSLLDLRRELGGKLDGPRQTIFPRSGLEAFLRRRWQGAASAAPRLGQKAKRTSRPVALVSIPGGQQDTIRSARRGISSARAINTPLKKAAPKASLPK